MELVESVPNVSEGRDEVLIRALADGITHTDHLHLLDVHADPFHHRSVFTIVGPPSAVAQAVFGLARTSIEHIDLREHRGEHPRLGAIDVIPFVPLHNMSIPAAVALAEEVARRIAGETGVPTVLYGHAARTDAHRRLAAIRGKGVKALGEDGVASHLFRPDFGPPRLHPSAGATVVGVRDLLVAFNVLLDTAEIAIAREIARRVRTSSGGRPGIQALGFRVHGYAQVSMNLYELRRTTIVDAFDDVASHARELGVEIRESEIVGLAPDLAMPANEARVALAGTLASHSLDAALAACYPSERLALGK